MRIRKKDLLAQIRARFGDEATTLASRMLAGAQGRRLLRGGYVTNAVGFIEKVKKRQFPHRAYGRTPFAEMAFNSD
jgi:hypothetical protein